ncbi:MAG TPA: sugar ABC transporter ATP-binding protein [Bdellovibrionota bacterium]|nr:sugar ABC transporter ATP-binding protein [Bdellovibrionota bacterium]
MSQVDSKKASNALLELRDVVKEFPGTRALDRVSLEVRSGEVLALLGENGAGKSTLMKILSGVWPHGSFEGEVRVAGSRDGMIAPEARKFKDTRDAHAAGIAMIHQELSVFPELTVAEHLELDQLPHWINWSELHARTQKFLDGLDLGLRSDMRVGDLSVGGRQLVEIARALYRDANILVFDEPTSALTEQEVQHLYTIIEKLRAEGRAIIYITHRLDEVFRLADRMVVLRDGRNAGETPRSVGGVATPRSELEPRIISWMVGRPIHDIYPKRNAKFGEEMLRVEGLTLVTPAGKKLVDKLSFTVKRGEVLGLAGLLGAGRSETFEAIFGVLNPGGPRLNGYRISGNVWIKGQRRDLANPAQAIQARMAFVSEDRKGTGLVLKQSIRSNMVLPSLVAGRGGIAHGNGIASFVAQDRETQAVERWMKELRVKAAHMDQLISELSGGNQQKVVLAKWLMTEPEILFLDEPTRGIDVGAKVEIYQWIQKLAAEGIAVMVASSEMPELLGVCHRLLVLREGHLSADLPAEAATQEDIMRAASL